jgi:hypothetical protein
MSCRSQTQAAAVRCTTCDEALGGQVTAALAEKEQVAAGGITLNMLPVFRLPTRGTANGHVHVRATCSKGHENLFYVDRP